jgi:3-dehydroquinate synthetase
MRRVQVSAPGGSYEILIGAALQATLPRLIAPLAATRLLVVTDSKVAPLYGTSVAATLQEVAPTAVLHSW